MSATSRQSVILLLVVWAVSAALVIAHMGRGWVPHDEGLIGQTAERVIAGELPHRDFDDVYTGGLAYVNAGAMRLFGTSVRSPRIVLVTLFLLCVPVLFYVARRFASPLAAAATTLLAVAWSLPNYIASLPSWYNLIFAVLGAAALLRFVDIGKRRWLFIAGVCGGLSFLMKVVGLYYVAAGLLFLVFREQELGGDPPFDGTDDTAGSNTRSTIYSAFVIGGLLVFVLALVRLVHRSGGSDYLVHFVFPGAALAAALTYNEWAVGTRRGTSRSRFSALARLVVPFLAGVAVPIGLFLVPYVMSGAVGDLVRGVFITPARRLTFAATPPLGWRHGVWTLVVVGLLLVARYLSRAVSLRVAALVAIAGTYMVVLAAVSSTLYRAVFYAAVLLPIATVFAAAPLVAGLGKIPSERRQRLLIVASGLATFALIQFPFGAPIYFCYVTPLLALGVLAVMRELELPSPAVPATLAATFLAFAVLRMHPGFLFNVGIAYARYEPLAPLPSPRGGDVRIPAPMAAGYTQLVDVVRRHAGSDSSYIYAAPDAPEVYFLTGLKNPTRTMYDFFDNKEARTERLLASLRAHDVRVVAINTTPEFSPKVEGVLRSTLEREYPRSVGVGPFEVRWRE